MKTRTFLTPLLSLTTALALVALPAESQAKPKSWVPTEAVSTESGLTKVNLDDDLLAALDTLGVQVSRLAPATVLSSKRGIVAFPIAGGIFDPVATSAEILHRGGLILSTDDTKVVLSSFIISLPEGGSPVLTGLVTVDGEFLGRVPLFKLDLGSASIDLRSSYLKVGGVNLTLTSEAATALNGVFGVTAFAPGATVGKADILSYLRALTKGSSVKPPKPNDDDDDDDDDD